MPTPLPLLQLNSLSRNKIRSVLEGYNKAYTIIKEIKMLLQSSSEQLVNSFQLVSDQENLYDVNCSRRLSGTLLQWEKNSTAIFQIRV